MKLLCARVPVLLLIFGALAFAYRAHAAVDDFTRDVQAAAQGQNASAITGGEYKSAWDEFGTSVIVSGNVPASQISEAVMDDITHDASRQVGYEQAETHYLETIHSTPEDVQATEDAGGADLLPQDAIDPYPSLEANPGTDYSSVDDLQAIDAQSQLSTPPVSSDAGTSTPSSDVAPADLLTAPSGDWQPNDVTVLQAIVDTPSDQSGATDTSTPPTDDSSAPTDAPIPDAPADAPPPDASPAPDASSAAPTGP